MRYILAILATLALVGLASPSHAGTGRTTRLEPPVRHVAHVKVVSVQETRTSRLWIEFNTGSLWSVAPCKWEHSNNCYWDARKRGNGKGKSFVTLKGKTYYSSKIRS